MSAAVAGDRTAHDALRDLWGDRDAVRRSQLTPARTRFLMALLAVERDAAELDKRSGDHPRCALPQLKVFAAALANAWSGEGGWDTVQLISALEAMSVQTTIQSREEAPDG